MALVWAGVAVGALSAVLGAVEVLEAAEVSEALVDRVICS